MTMESVENSIGCPFNNRCYLYSKGLCHNYYSHKICSEFPVNYAEYRKKMLCTYNNSLQERFNFEYFNTIQNFLDYLNIQYYSSNSLEIKQMIHAKIDIYENLLKIKLYLV
ncbi:MAG: hypothetical protein ACFFCM_22955 [Promethearchaeota archaeon]